MAHSAQTVESAVALSYIVRAEAPRVGPIRLHYALSHRSAAGQPTETAKARPGDDRKIQLIERRKSKQTASTRSGTSAPEIYDQIERQRLGGTINSP